jgi:hypothetical protein
VATETLDIKDVIKIAAARGSRGAKLESVRIVGQDKSVQIDALELRKHVLHLEYGPGDDAASGGTDTSDLDD